MLNSCTEHRRVRHIKILSRLLYQGRRRARPMRLVKHSH